MEFLSSIIQLLIWQKISGMPKTIISDASCFILLEKISASDLLAKTYGKVTTTPLNFLRLLNLHRRNLIAFCF